MNFLVKLSQNNKVIVPIVVVIALTIFGGSYLIQNNRQVARQETEQQQTEAETKDDDLVAVEEIKEAEPEPEVEKTEPETEKTENTEKEEDKDYASPEKIEVKITVSGNDVVLSFSSDKAGKCTLAAQEDGDKKVETTNASSGRCTFNNFLSDDIDKVYGYFVADDSSVKGYAEKEI